jgi:hypothetical protein
VPSVRGQLAIGVVQHSGAAFTELLRPFVISDETPFGSDAGARSNKNHRSVRANAEHIPLISHHVLEFVRLQGLPKPGRPALGSDRGYQYDKR